MRNGTIEDAGVRLQVVLGETTLPLKRLAELIPGSILQLQSLAGEPVELLAAGEPIARGEVVVIEENFGLRVTEVLGGGGPR